ncbi:MAG TPA: phosphoribosylanthranilate isomerase [Bryobacteraceae bacterium]|nr:phosphoribosylanthranilate isomerase [Bryobacteraceae bacterium]
MMIKICGITREEDAVASADAGATAIGFNFYRKSKRFIEPPQAADIGRDLNLLRVGVFVDEEPETVAEIAAIARLDVAQLHGGETADWNVEGLRLWKAFRITPDWTPNVAANFNVEAVLLDGPVPGSGTPFEWSRARELTQRLVIAGGLDHTNVGEAIRIAQPWGVDACSKLESQPGVKDAEKLRLFVEAARDRYL